ncbi:ammonium transporter channel family [Achlya hypogyna]|uniref:Ammonium transporter channel family n=1 Tax=Achlya hypogyna TaxID=1202772 RepID=A0A1V9ZU82_ACHHY|nr:ammonium transporter channel family [Achlya hypogyna]
MASANATLVVVVNGTPTTYAWSAFAQAMQRECASLGTCEPASSPVDILWLLFCTLQTFLILPGFVLRSARGTIVLHLAAVAALLSYAFTFAIAFVGGDGFLGHGGGGFALTGAFFDDDPSGARIIVWLQQLAVACVLTAIMASGLERLMSPQSLLIYIVFVLVVVYPPIVHAVWSPIGWLSPLHHDGLFGTGIVDMAGSTVVHITAGTAVLIAALALRSVGEGAVQWHTPTSHHSLATLFLWLGWYGLIQVSTPSLRGGCSSVAAGSIANATLAATAGGLVSALLNWALHLVDDDAVNHGVLSGLVAISAPAATVHPALAVGIGAVAAVVYTGGSRFLQLAAFSGPCHVVAIHLGNGLWGTVAAGFAVSSTRLAAARSCSTDILFGGAPNSTTTQACGLWERCGDDLGLRQWGANCIGGVLVFFWSLALCFMFSAPLVYWGCITPPVKEATSISFLDDSYSMTSDLDGSNFHDFEPSDAESSTHYSYLSPSLV